MKNASLTTSILMTLLMIAPASVLADSFEVTYLGPGVQTPSVTSYYETFDSGPSFTGTTTFGGSGITGTYTGSYVIRAADQYGGAGGTGYFIATNSGSYTLTLSQQVNYFGMWFSALDQGNDLYFYDNGTLVYSFLPSDYETLVGPCPSGSNPYCGNPNPPFLGDNDSQQYAFLNFLDTTGTFNTIVFTEYPQVGQFESDNQSVAANITTIPGTPITPEPSSLILLGSGVLGLAEVIRRRHA